MESNIYNYEEEIRPIDSIEFNILGNEELLRLSVFDGVDKNGVELAELYDTTEPKKNGLIDTRMGTTDSGGTCGTCGFTSQYCVGHFGHITLAEPIFHMGYIQYIKKILSCVCLKCSKLLVYKNEDELDEMLKNKSGKARWAEIKNIAKNVGFCQKQNYGCGTQVSKIKLEIKKLTATINIYSETNISNVVAEDGTTSMKKKVRQILTPEICYNIFRNISDNHCKIMGFDPEKSRPEMMIHTIFPVPPVAVRPSAKIDFMASSTMEDDLTHKLADIIKANIRMRKYKNSTIDGTGKYSLEHAHLLQYHGATYYDNETASLPRSEQRGKSSKSITSRLKGKEGRVRGNLMGKRVDYSARTVITGDPTIDIDELGLPKKIAMILTFPEVVTPYNIDKLQELVKNGRDNYPGANYVFPIGSSIGDSDKRVLQIDLRYRKEKVVLKFGDVVERHIVDGDPVLLNRQPTLHKLSMMGHRIKVIDDPDLSSFRLCPNVTKPYNADFDGDEMNIFVPQSIQTQIELVEIANVKNQIISPRTGGPSIGAVQDNLIGAYNLTNPSMRIHWKDAMNIVSYTAIDDFSTFKKDTDYVGADLFSLIIPNNINAENAGIIIKNGKIEKGQIRAAHIGNTMNSITHHIWNEYDSNESAKFLNNMQKLINNFNLYNGFTIGIGDIEIPKEVESDIIKMVEQKKLELYHTITDMENNPDLVDIDTFENFTKSDLNSVSDNMGTMVIKNLSIMNNVFIMIESGAKGTISNMSQMVACLGQQNLEGKRIRKRINNRALAYNHQNDDSASGRGFVSNPFIKGLTPAEFIIHNMTSREGMIDTAIKTAESGYIQRRLIKGLEDIKIMYDATVRNANDTILQFTYGEDSVDATKQYAHDLKMLEMGNSEIKNTYCFDKNKLKSFQGFGENENEKYYNTIIEIRNIIRKSKISLDLYNTNFNKSCFLPVNINLIVNTIKNNKSGKTKLEPKYILEMIDDVLSYKNTKMSCMDKEDSENINSLKYKDEMMCKMLLKLALYEYLCPKVLIEDLQLSKEDFDVICKKVINNYNNSMIQPGEMVGVIAAQSIGEPTTQMTLNTFHHAGVGSKSAANLGTTRMKELMSFSTNLKTPIMNIVLEKQYRDNSLFASRIESHIKYTELKSIRKKVDVYFDPDMHNKNGHLIKDNVINQYTVINPSKYSCQKDFSNLPWLIRIELDREKMMETNVTLTDVKVIFCSNWENRNKVGKSGKKEDTKLLEKISNCAILSNYDNDPIPILHIRFDMMYYEYDTIKSFIANYIDIIKLKGIPNINGTSVESQRTISFDNSDEKLQIIDKNYVIYTKGVNMIDVRYINGIDLTKTISNDIVSIYKTFGIEAARTMLIKELGMIFANAFISPQHISILVDQMTNTGGLTSIDRHGLNKLDTDPLPRCSFEKTVDQLLNAAVFGEVDHMNSVSARIMAGLVIKGGTGMCNIILNTELLENSEYVDDTENKYRKTFTELSKDTLINDIVNNESSANFFLPE